MSTTRDRITSYNTRILSGQEPSNKWIYAAALRFEADLNRADIFFDWEEAERLTQFFQTLTLVGEYTDQPFQLQEWQEWVVSQIICWKFTADNRRRYRLALVQVARGAGKTTLMAGLCLYDLLHGSGKRVSVIANSVDQAEILLDTAKTMVTRLNREDVHAMYDVIRKANTDCEMNALPSLERSLDGLNPSMWIADEAAEYKGRFLTKLLTTGAKRKQSTGVIITTPGSNPENIYGELIKQCESILSKELVDDSVCGILYGLDKDDAIDDESAWPKANPGLSYGQPDIQSLRRSWNTMKNSPMGRAEFNRFHAARTDEFCGGWLDMDFWSHQRDDSIDWDSLKGRPAWGGLDLSKSGDMTAFVLAIPLDDGRVAIKGRYWWPKDGLAQRELDYRMPVRAWEKEGKLETTPGREIDYERIRVALNEAAKEYDLRMIAYDAWGSKYLAECLLQDGLPLQTYRMSISTFGPGCALFQNLWLGKKLVIPDDPVLRRACAEALAKTDMNGNVRPIKAREHCSIDSLVATIMAVHGWGGKTASIYEIESDLINNPNGGKP